MAGMLEHALARRTIGNSARPVGGVSILEGISAQSLTRRRDKRNENSAVVLKTAARPLGISSGVLSHERKAIDAGLVLCSAALGARCQAEGEGQTQTIKNETIATNKAPLQSKQMSPKLDDGAGGFPPKDGDDGGGGGGGGGGWGQGGFVFWALLLIVGFLRDRELDKPYKFNPKKLKRQSYA